MKHLLKLLDLSGAEIEEILTWATSSNMNTATASRTPCSRGRRWA